MSIGASRLLCNVGNAKIVELLLRNGANVNHQNEIGKAAIHRAVEYDQDEIVDLLLRYGADVNSTDYYGRTPLYMASRNGNQKIVK